MLAGLPRPGPPPPTWPRVAAVILAATLLQIGLLLYLGTTLYDNAGYPFR
jgi:hypothetical protein